MVLVYTKTTFDTMEENMSTIIKTEALVRFTVKVQIGVSETENAKEIMEQIVNEAEDLIHTATNGSIGRESFKDNVDVVITKIKCSNANKFVGVEDAPTDLVQEKPEFDVTILGFNMEDTIE